ncbi:cytochrome C [Tabrizicola sp. J26]|uniref:c-type cytochrome n=1 Tax=Alitabrizicola rongguiensis TaxID=2909234 RepID=UPI001F403445|nr:cytochrome C [Tabrizicola rongguiensis]MCF1708495.1 cytochrome C [Tabrizicola rongguiensis]
MKFLPLIASLTLVAAPVFAEGDAAKGENEFKKCKACHAITAPDGTDIVKGGKVGPNLYGVVGRPLASVEGFAYGDGIKEAAGKGLVWDEAMIAAYVADPTKWLEEQTGDPKAKSKMSFKLPKGGEDVAAYLASVAK